MIGTILRIFWIHLRRHRVVGLLRFVVPVAIFSIFAIVFSGQPGRGSTPRVHVAVVDLDGSEFSQKLVAAIKAEKSLVVEANSAPPPAAASSQESPGDAPAAGGSAGQPLTREAAEALVRSGGVSAAIILPQGFGASFPGFGGERPTVEVLADTADPIAPQMLGGLLQGLVMTAAPDAMMKGGIEQLQKFGGPLTPEQQRAIDIGLKYLNPPANSGSKSDR